MGDNVDVGIYSVSEALLIAKKLETDLVEISPKALPPVCKAMDYKKFLYEQKKRDKYLKAKTRKLLLKRLDLVLKQTYMIMSLRKNMR